ncbi:MAG: RNA methyltransferase [Prevotellaceae bacterium]|jgi:TrmH family RNA methyltransferase|nr:RNA methyltransferase [Prevotellaceae bacterium]
MITSSKNERIKAVCELREKSRERRRQGLFVVEGCREITLAMEAGYPVHTLFFCPEMPAAATFAEHAGKTVPAQAVSREVFGKMACREHSDGLLALSAVRNTAFEELKLSGNPFIIIVEAVEKPGNLGAILRTADAAAADAVVVCSPLADIYNPNVIRSSLGCVFTQQVVAAGAEETVAWLHAQQIVSYAAELSATQWYHETDFTKPCAIVMGTEAEGLSPYWLQQAGARIKIPMRGRVDSLNVSVSTAILAFEAMRQRGFSRQ